MGVEIIPKRILTCENVWNKKTRPPKLLDGWDNERSETDGYTKLKKKCN